MTRRRLRRVLAASVLVVVTGAGAALAITSWPGRSVEQPVDVSTIPVHDLFVVGLGDSVMAGTACDCAGPVKEYEAGLRQTLHRTVRGVNLGADGDTAEELADRVRTDADTRADLRRADVVLVIEGANDLVPQLDQFQDSGCDATCYRPAVGTMGDRMASALRTVRDLSGTHARIVVAGYWNVFADGDAAREEGGDDLVSWSREVTRAANAAISSAAASAHATYVDLTPVFLQDGSADPTELLAEDGDHPNATGVRLMVRRLLAVTKAPD